MFTLRLKSLRMEPGRVTRAFDPMKRQALGAAGRYIRVAARSSLRKRKSVSVPGHPPSSHEGSLRRLLLFAVDLSRETVVIGPIPFREGTAPAILEAGGRVTAKRTLWVRGPSGRNARGRFTAGRARKVDRGAGLQYKARPYMGPAKRTGLRDAAAKTGNPLIRAWANAQGV